ncbi:hypothetical protein MOP88_17110 [Sphingomonas sp. WKB10]|nr:hypothetical protein [Sphingomonas sp. WKB10]
MPIARERAVEVMVGAVERDHPDGRILAEQARAAAKLHAHVGKAGVLVAEDEVDLGAARRQRLELFANLRGFRSGLGRQQAGRRVTQADGASLGEDAGDTGQVGLALQHPAPFARIAHRADIALQRPFVVAHRDSDIVAIMPDELLQVEHHAAHRAFVGERHLQGGVRARTQAGDDRAGKPWASRQSRLATPSGMRSGS